MEPRSGEAAPVPADARIGTRLAGYRVEALLGRGGMSVVYRAEDLRLQRPVALKVLAPELATDAHFRERFLRESQLAASIDHPNIIPIYEADEADGCLFIAMRYVEGTDLKALLHAEGLLEVRRSLDIAAQVADALDAAHEHGLVHRDVKPSNILVDPRGHCYLADFGLTTSAIDRSSLAAQHEVVGTVDYVAPEQLRSEPVDGRADVYSLGCLLFECLTGEVPFPHDSEVAVIYAQLEEPPPRASERRASLPAELDQPLTRAMAKLSEERYSSCAMLVEAVRDGLGLPHAAGAQTRRGRYPLVAVAAGIAVLIAAAGTWALTRPGAVVAPAGSDVLIGIDPAGNTVGTATQVGHGASAVALAGSVAWVANYGDDSVTRVDTASGDTRTIAVKGSPVDIAVHGSVVDVVNAPPNVSVVTIDAATDAVGAAVPLAGDSHYAPLIAAGGGRFWLADAEAQTLSAASAGGTFLGLGRTIAIPADTASLLTEYVSFDGLAVDEQAVWVAGDAYGRTVWKVDPAGGRVTPIALPFIPAGIAAGAGGVWVTSLLDDKVVRIDPVSNRVLATIPVGRGASAIAVGLGSVWVADSLADAVSRIDPRTGAVTTIPVGAAPTDIAIGAGRAWITGRKL